MRAIERTALPRPSDRSPTRSRELRRASARRTARAYSFAREEWCDFEIIDRDALPTGAEALEGPAIVMETTTTSYIDAGLAGSVHDSGALILTAAADV